MKAYLNIDNIIIILHNTIIVSTTIRHRLQISSPYHTMSTRNAHGLIIHIQSGHIHPRNKIFDRYTKMRQWSEQMLRNHWQPWLNGRRSHACLATRGRSPKRDVSPLSPNPRYYTRVAGYSWRPFTQSSVHIGTTHCAVGCDTPAWFSATPNVSSAPERHMRDSSKQTAFVGCEFPEQVNRLRGLTTGISADEIRTILNGAMVQVSVVAMH